MFGQTPSPKPSRVEIVVKSGLGLTAVLLVMAWLIYTPPDLLGKADALGYAVCHRIDLRSFHIGVTQMPLCARCTGMYLGAVLGLAFQWLTARRAGANPPRRVIAVLGVFFLAFALDGSNSFLALILKHGLLYEPNNTLRLLTGTGMGLVIAAALFPAFTDTVWADSQPQPALGGFRQLAWLVGLALVMDLLVLSQNWVVLYFAALVSAGGVLVVLGMVYSLVAVIVVRRERAYHSTWQFGWLTLAGLTIALAQIFAIDIVRFAVTHTWNGFPLG